jgi:hypothetical protein
MPEQEHINEIDYQVNKPNGDIDFITVYDLPESIAYKFVKNKYPNCEIEFLSSIIYQTT